MSEFTFKGEVSALNEKQLDVVKTTFTEHGFKNGNVEIVTVGKPGDNYVANVKRAIIEKDGKVFKTILKIAPFIEMVRSAMSAVQVFRNEEIMYTEFLPKVAQLEIDNSVPAKERLKYAKCYGTSMEAPYEIVILEDLAVQGFVMLDRFTSLTDESIKLILSDFAKLHSASFALKHLEPETFLNIANSLENLWKRMADFPDIENYMNDSSTDMKNLINDEKYNKIVELAMSSFLKESVDLDRADKSACYSVIIQGDPWTNNILFRLEGQKPVESCMIDYQLSRESSPVADIVYMIFNCTDYETRAKHYHDWLDFYYSQLSKRLKLFGLTTDSTYTRDQFERDLKRYSIFALGQSIMLASLLMRESKDAAKFKEAMDRGLSMEDFMKENKMSSCDEVSLKRIKKRVVGLIDSFIDLGYVSA